jgi:hypothetical protein
MLLVGTILNPQSLLVATHVQLAHMRTRHVTCSGGTVNCDNQLSQRCV